ncbi:universal stress protein [Streptomyces sp. NPDC091217]|uniref:universal stress protein n=1 Tax=Streptomyces sp. NPDC091217 TaxID=3365975 RepID=UPI00382529FA
MKPPLVGSVVVAVGDTAETGAGAVRFALREAEARGSALTAVRAWRVPSQEPVDHMLIADDATRLRGERASAALGDALRQAVRDHPRVDVHRHVVEGPAHRVRLEAAAQCPVAVVPHPG